MKERQLTFQFPEENKMSSENDIQAFPSAIEWQYDHQEIIKYEENGMSLRDYYAGIVLGGELASQSDNLGHYRLDEGENRDALARICYLMADSMLKARKGS
jgi:hypothetical protein